MAAMEWSAWQSTNTTIGSKALVILGSVAMSILSIVIILGNGLIIVAITLVKKLREPANYFIVSLALSDFLVGFIVLPLNIVYDVGGEWVFGSMMCDVHVSFDVICCTASIMNLCLISIDRPLTYPKGRNTTRMMIGIAFAWIISGVVIIPALFGFTENVKDAPGWIKLSNNSLTILGKTGDDLVDPFTVFPIDDNFTDNMISSSKTRTRTITFDMGQVYNIQKFKIMSSQDFSKLNIQSFSIQTNLCFSHYSETFNETFVVDSTSLGLEEEYILALTTAARLVRLRINQPIEINDSNIWQFSLYGEKLTGKICLISQEVWFTIYSTVMAFFIPLIVMLCMYCRIYVEASRFNERQKERLSCRSSQDGDSSNSLYLASHHSTRRRRASCSGSCGQLEKELWKYTPRYNEMRIPKSECESREVRMLMKQLSETKNNDISSPIADCNEDENEVFIDCTNENTNACEECRANSEKKITTSKSLDELLIYKDNVSIHNPLSPTRNNQSIEDSVSNALCRSQKSYKQRNNSLPSLRSRTLSESNKDDSTYNSKYIKSFSPPHNGKSGSCEEDSTLFPPIFEDDVLELKSDEVKCVVEQPKNNYTCRKFSRSLQTRRSNSDASLMFSGKFIHDRNHNSSFLRPWRNTSLNRSFNRRLSNHEKTRCFHNSACCFTENGQFEICSRFKKSSLKRGQIADNYNFKRPSLLSDLRRRLSTSTTSSQNERSNNIKATKTLGAIVGAFTCCWLPFFVVTFIRPFVCEHPESQDCMPLGLVRVVLWLGYVNSALNPVIYIGFSPDLKDTFRLLLRCHCKNVDRKIAQQELRNDYKRERRYSLSSRCTVPNEAVEQQGVTLL